MGTIEKKSILRREEDILDRLENVKRLIQMETTLMTAEGAGHWRGYCWVNNKGDKISDTLLKDLREQIQLQLLSITALCNGDNPDVGEPVPMLEWNTNNEGRHPADVFHDVWEKCLIWNA